MPPTDFPLRWESTGDQWWYACPIDWAAANGHYDLVRELLRLDGNHLIKLTSLRRIRRLETVWDDEEQLQDVAKHRAQVARKLFLECDQSAAAGKKNSLIHAGYGGWLIYTAASAGDSSFVRELLDRNPLLVFGEGEYGVTDILYAAARSKNSEVFRLVFGFAMSPRFLTEASGRTGEVEEHIGDIPEAYKTEMMNRGVHAAARGGNVEVLKELVGGCEDVLGYRDKQGCTLLHAAAGRGQVEVVKYLVDSFDIINSRDNQGNTALHVAAHRGQSEVVDALISASTSLISQINNSGETFLHATVSGFQTPAFRRLDRQKQLMKLIVGKKSFEMEEYIVNAKNNDGRTALHTAIIGNVHSDLVELLMSARSINVNIRDLNGMTPLDLLRQSPRSPSSDILIRQLISAGGIFGCPARRAIASQLKMQGSGSKSPGTSFRVSDAEIFLHAGLEIAVNVKHDDDPGSGGIASSRTESSHFETSNKNNISQISKKTDSVNSAAQRLKRVFHWPRFKDKKAEKLRKNSVEALNKSLSSTDGSLTPLRQRFSKPSSPSSSSAATNNNKRTLSVRSTQSSPIAKKKMAAGLVHGVMHAIPHINIASRRSRSSSFSKSSVSSPYSIDKQKGVVVDIDSADSTGPSCSNKLFDDEYPQIIEKQGSINRKVRSQYFCCGHSGLSVKTPVSRQYENTSIDLAILSMA